MKVQTAAAAVLLTAALGGCSQTPWVYDRPGATLAQVRGDQADCQELAGREPGQFIPTQPTLAGAAGAGAIGGVADVIREAKAAEACMAQRGYVEATLTPEQAQAVKSARRGAERDAAVQAVMYSNEDAQAEPINSGDAYVPHTSLNHSPSPDSEL